MRAGRQVLRLIFALGLGFCSAEVQAQQLSHLWPRWQLGGDAGARAFGRFSASGDLNSPPGDIGIQLSGHVWYRHLVQLHLSPSLGVKNSTFSFAFGTKLNLIEFTGDLKHLIEQGFQRGIFPRLFKNFMFYVGLDGVLFSFKEPNPEFGLTYPTSAIAWAPGVGAQWYFTAWESFARKFYVDTSLYLSRMSNGTYLMPQISIGFELAPQKRGASGSNEGL